MRKQIHISISILITIVLTTIVIGVGNGRIQVASAIASCSGIDVIDAGEAWLKGYHDAHKDFKGLNGHGYDESTHMSDKSNYVSGYRMGWDDARKGINGPFCLGSRTINEP